MKAMILSVSANGAIGNKNDLIWKNSEDMKRFKAITLNNNIIMGRKTMESIPKFPLPMRRNIVLSNSIIDNNSNEFSVMSFEDTLKLDNFIVIGGAILYEQYLSHVNRIYITHIEEYLIGDTFFKPLDWSWKCTENIQKDGFSFQIWDKIL
jgi:dihydrofolate reductase